MDTRTVKVNDVVRGDLIRNMDGYPVVADTFSVDHAGNEFWHCVDGSRVFPSRDGHMTVYVVDVSTGHAGTDRNGVTHAVLGERHSVGSGKAPCDKRLKLDVWESGTALSSVTCLACRARYGLLG